jgi:hypothetical protein
VEVGKNSEVLEGERAVVAERVELMEVVEACKS